ncbi:magnesium transporter [candidate division KSB1 bacterium 4484_188]|nr:MAG: magnesium transporter [candidate division KSB1 bacterium 4484_188]
MNPGTKDLNLEEIFDNIRYLIKKEQKNLVLNIIADLHPADIAELMSHLDDDERRFIFNLLPSEISHEVLVELEENVKEDVLEGMDTSQIAEMVNEMDSDDAADLVSDLSAEQATEVLEKVEDESSEEIQELLLYPEDTAGGLMAKEYVAVNADMTEKDAIEEIRKKHQDVEDLYYCFVTDDFGTLLGTVSLRDLILAEPNTKIRDIMKQDIISIDSDMDQEEVAKIFKKYDLVVAPVVNKRHKLIGRITIDDVVDVIDEEIEEDLGRIAGTGEEEILEDSVLEISRSRLPWLFISFFGEMVSALILKSFSATMEQIVATAFFIPLVMATGGSAGQQSSIIVVRGLGTGEIGLKDTRRRLKREFFVALLNGAVLAALIFLLVVILLNDYAFGTLLSITLITIIMNATIFGAVIPLFFKKINIDPALATGPFVATFNDIIGLMIYFILLTAGMKFFL